jgi:hypothetical protein
MLSATASANGSPRTGWEPLFDLIHGQGLNCRDGAFSPEHTNWGMFFFWRLRPWVVWED